MSLRKCVKIPNAVLVSGLTRTIADEEVFELLKRYGPILRTLEVSATKAIVEYQSGAAVDILEATIMPYQRPSVTDPTIIHTVESLASVYTTDVGAAATSSFLSGLKEAAKLSGRQFSDILRDELARISSSITDDAPSAQVNESPNPKSSSTKSGDPTVLTDPVTNPADVAPTLQQPSFQIQGDLEALSSPSSAKDKSNIFHLPSDQLSTPEVQRVVVEHIVRSSELGSHIQSHYKLRSFSGRYPQPNFEVDYETWRKSVEFYINDPSIPDSQIVRRIVESLSSPAADIVKSIAPQAPSKEYLLLLDSAYATVEDGDELFARFLNNHENAGEKASDYLQ